MSLHNLMPQLRADWMEKRKVAKIARRRSVKKVYPDERPLVRDQCYDMPRPCPFVSCEWHILHARHKFLIKRLSDDDIMDIIFNSSESCILDVCDYGAVTNEYIAMLTGLTKQRVHQVVGFDVECKSDKYKNTGALKKLRNYKVKKLAGDFVWDNYDSWTMPVPARIKDLGVEVI